MEVGEPDIQMMREHIETLRYELWRAENKYRKIQLSLQEICSREGHEFVKEQGNDYHNPGCYYTCKRCDHVSKRNW